MTIIPQTSKYLEKVAKKKESRLLQTYVLTEFLTAAQLLKFPINVSFWSNFEPVEISQKFNFLLIDYDSRKFLKASRMHRSVKHSNAIFKKFLTAKSISSKCYFSCREQLIYAMNMLLLINFQKIKMDLFSSCINVKPTVNWIHKYVVFPLIILSCYTN